MGKQRYRTSNRGHNAWPERKWWQYVLETLWAGLVGAAVGCWQP